MSAEPVKLNPTPPVAPLQPLPEKPVVGTSVGLAGVSGQSNDSFGVMGQCMGPPGSVGSPGFVATSDGVYGVGKNGVHGLTYTGQTNVSGLGNSGVLGENLNTGTDGGNGVSGVSMSGHGVYGQTAGNGSSNTQTLSPYCGVCGVHVGNGSGVLGSAKAGFGVVAVSDSNYGLFAEGGKGAATFNGDVNVNGNMTVSKDVLLTGADCAEQFDSAESRRLEPGTVVVIDNDGALRESRDAYDKRVAGVVSGAGEYRPAIVLDRRASSENRISVALVGKVYCKVDAEPAPIGVGDLLTTSARPGFGMKASDSKQAFGAVIGKALMPLRDGQGVIPILVALQ